MSTAAATGPGVPENMRGRIGMASLIVAEISFFAVFIVAYLFYLGKSTTGPQPGEVLKTPIAATICLLASSVTIAIALRALRAGSLGGFRAWWLATILLGAGFLFATALEWHELIHERGLTIATNLFGTTFYSLVGFHALHVTLGLCMLAFVLAASLRGRLQPADAERTEILSWYWHFVDAVWVAVFSVVYLTAR
ncbi:cytochrome c oxidase subunit 3 [bacterium]|nr:cytochrome c oxidase subunit 3 [bacterium]